MKAAIIVRGVGLSALSLCRKFFIVAFFLKSTERRRDLGDWDILLSMLLFGDCTGVIFGGGGRGGGVAIERLVTVSTLLDSI